MRAGFVFLFSAVASWAQELNIEIPFGVIRGCSIQTLTITRGTAPFSFRLVGPVGDRPIYQEEEGIPSPYTWTLPPFSVTVRNVYMIAFDNGGIRGESRVFNITAGLCAVTSTTTTSRTSSSSTTSTSLLPSTTETTSTTSRETPTFTPDAPPEDSSTNSPTTSSSPPPIENSSELQPSSSSSSPSQTPSQDPSSNSPNTGLIAGVVSGGSIGLILIIIGIWIIIRKKSSSSLDDQPDYFSPKMEASEAPVVTPPPHRDSVYSPTTPFAVPYFDGSRVSPPIGRSLSAYSSTGPTYTSTASSPSPYFPQNLTYPLVAANQGPYSDPVMAARSTSPSVTEDVPPIYDAAAAMRADSHRARANEAEQARIYDALITDFCATNRDLISPELESKLYTARYLPKDNPSDIPAEYWRNSYGVEILELRRLQEAYERNLATQALLNAPEKAIPQAALSAKEKALQSTPQGGS